MTNGERDLLQRVVAVLIIVVTLLGALVAFLQTQAGNRESSAAREAQAAAIETSARTVESQRRFNIQAYGQDVSEDAIYRQVTFFASRNRDTYARAQAEALLRAVSEIGAYTNALFGRKYVRQESPRFDFSRFFQDQFEVGYRASELQKAFERERDGWGRKGNRFITVITVYAVALFLLGLTLTVPGGARRPFLWMGIVVATGATLAGLAVWAGSVDKPSRDAIAAYAAGQAKLDVVQSSLSDFVPDPTAAYRGVVTDMTRALETRGDYQEALVARGSAYFRLDLRNPQGPRGSEEARDDWQRAAELNPEDYVSWGDLGAAEYWLRDYASAQDATEQALELQPQNPAFNLNQALVLKVQGEEEQYREQLRRVRQVFAAIPEWLRAGSINDYQQVFDLSLRYRPALRPRIRELRADLLRTVHEIDAALRTVGKTEPDPVQARFRPLQFKLSPNRKVLTTTFRWEGVQPSQRWLYDTYLNGERDLRYSYGPVPWSSATPDGDGDVPFTEPTGFAPGTQIRIEVYVEGNFMTAGDFTVPAASR